MVKIRLKRFGKKLRPFYRIVVIQSRTKRQGEALEEIGSYDPIKKITSVNSEKALLWLSKGAQPSDTVKTILVKNGVLKAPKHTKKYANKPGKKSTERAANKAAKSSETSKSE